MTKILIIDDNIKRHTKLLNELNKNLNTEYLKISSAYTADEARIELKNNHFDLLILDVTLPKKKGNTPTAKTGILLLKDLHKNERYFCPTKIIGITAFTDELASYKLQFEESTSIVIDASYNKTDWIEYISQDINNLIRTSIKKENINKKSILITIHGIRTKGAWQKEIKSHISKHSNNFEFFSIQYGYFSLFSFLLPIARQITLKNVNLHIEKVINENLDKKIYIIAHSFGSYLIANFLSQYANNKKIELLILSGSVLHQNSLKDYDLQSKAKKIINDCGIQDKVLMANKMFVWGLGDSGRIGLTTANSSTICNRYFIGGHSLYFQKEFYTKYWLPHLLTNLDLETITFKEDKWYDDFVEFFLNLFDKLKYFIYILIPIMTIVFFTSN